MCGIFGQVSREKIIDPLQFDARRDTLQHRGPDDAASWFSPNGKVGLGHRRLSFLDLSAAGRQPMTNEDATLWLTFNGEIYNYVELKAELLVKGHRFSSNTDSEVILHGYEEWGTGVVDRLKGMFAFGLWDEPRKRLFLARDRFGIKPLYYGWVDGSFCFASEIKALVKDADTRPTLRHASIADYLVYRYVPSPHTIWEGIFKLPPAHWLLLQDGTVPQVETYWQLPIGNRYLTPFEAFTSVQELLHDSVRNHLRSDTPIGAFLSGGYDSSALAWLMTGFGPAPNTFSIGFSNWEKSEHQYAQMVADQFGLPLYTAMAGEEQLGLLEKLMYHYDEPIADISIIPTYMVSQLAAQYNKAVFSGEGADEIFGGYWWQKEIARHPNTYSWTAWVQGKLPNHPNPLLEKYAEAMAMGRFTASNLGDYLHPDFRHAAAADSEWFYRSHYQPLENPLKTFQYLDVKTFMGELVLTKIDRASMAHSLEVRVPFLDHQLVELLFSMKPSVYFKPDVTKYLLHQQIQGVLPEAILRRPKQGFVGPDRYYMNIDWYARQLTEGYLLRENILLQKGLQKMIEEKDHWRLWKWTVLEKWARHWLV